MKVSQAEENKRILIVNVNWLGDVLFSTPFIKALRRYCPDGYIACMVVPRCREVLEGNPNLDEIILFHEDGKHKGFLGKLRFVRYLKSRGFHQAVLLHRSLTRTILVWLSGIPERIGYYTKKRGLLLTHRVILPGAGLHRARYYLNLAQAMGIEFDEDCGCEFFITDNERRWAQGFLKEEGIGGDDILVALNPGGNWEPKRWPWKNFAELADRLLGELGAKVVFTGSAKDGKLARQICESMKAPLPIISCGKTTLKQLGAIFERSNLVISNDSGPLHIAVSMKRQTLGLYGPTSPDITGPFEKKEKTSVVIHKDVGCQLPCYKLSCSDYKCMKAISVDEVFEAASALVEEQRKTLNLRMHTNEHK